MQLREVSRSGVKSFPWSWRRRGCPAAGGKLESSELRPFVSPGKATVASGTRCHARTGTVALHFEEDFEAQFTMEEFKMNSKDAAKHFAMLHQHMAKARRNEAAIHGDSNQAMCDHCNAEAEWHESKMEECLKLLEDEMNKLEPTNVRKVFTEVPTGVTPILRTGQKPIDTSGLDPEFVDIFGNNG
jgi:hypothetical protein